MTKNLSHYWTMLMVLAAALLLPGCQTQKPTETPAPTPAATSAAPAEKPETTAQTPAPTPASTPAAASAAESATPEVVVPANTTLRVKAGSDTAFTDSEGRLWQPDEGFSGGDTIQRDPDTKITGTKDPTMFMTERYSMDSFSVKIPNGKYTANLYFCETYDGISGPGQRVFSFNVQGHEFKDFDVWAKSGGFGRPYVVTVPVEVTNGVFRIDFTPQVENPQINAIEIIPNS
jgi:Malectin domain